MTAAAELFIRIGAEVGDFIKDTKRAQSALGDVFAGTLGAELAADALRAVGGALVDMGKNALVHLGEVETLMAQTTAAIRSTGGAAGVSADQIAAMANAIESATGVSGEMIQKGENLLLTFTNLKNGAGAGNDIFNQTTKIMADMSVALGQDASASAMQLGKALNDPIKGVSALQRVGVSFTESQKDSIKTLVEHGKTMDAQKIILRELTNEFGGSAQAYGQTFPGAVAKAEAALENLGDAIFGGAIPLLKNLATIGAESINAVADALTNGGIVEAMNAAFGPIPKAMILGIATALTAYLAPSITATVIPAIRSLALAWAPAIVAAGPFIALAAAVAFAAIPIMSAWDDLKTGMRDVWGVIASGAAGMWNRVRQVWQNMQDGAAAAAKTIISYLKPIFSALKPVWDKLPEQFRLTLGDVAGTAYHLPGEMAKNIAAGNGPVLGAARSLGRELASNLQYSWGGAISGARDFAGKLFAGVSSQSASFAKTVGGHVADGVAKAAKGGAKAAGDGAKEALGEATKAAKEYAEGLDRAEKAMALFSSRVGALTALGGAMEEVKAKGAELGGRFDMNAEAAERYKVAIDKLTHTGLSVNSSVVKDLTAAMGKYHDASEAGTKATKEAYGTLDTAAKRIDAARLKAELLGDAFDEGKVSTDAYRDAISTMVDAGIGKANPALTEAQARLAGVTATTALATPSLGALKDAAGNLFSSLGSLGGNLKTIAEDLGVPLLGPMGEAIGKFGSLGSAFMGVQGAIASMWPSLVTFGGWFTTAAIPALTAFGATIWSAVVPAVTAFGVALLANPIGLVVAAISGLILAGLALKENWGAVTKFLGGCWTAIADGAVAAFRGVASAVSTVWDGITGIIKGAINVIIGAMNLLVRGLNSIKIQIPDWVPNIGGRGWGGMQIPEIPYLAKGGIATGPTTAMIGEGRYPEAVLPLSDAVYSRIGQGIAAQGTGGGGNTYQVTINYSGKGRWTKDDANELGDLLVGRLARAGVR